MCVCVRLWFSLLVIFLVYPQCIKLDKPSKSNNAMRKIGDNTPIVSPPIYFKKNVTSDCSVVINEVNSDDPDKPEYKEFIELLCFCNGNKASHSLQGYKLLVLATGTRESSNTQHEAITTIEAVITLWNSHTDENGYFTIGGKLLEGANLKVPDPNIKYRRCFESRTEIAESDFIRNGNDFISAVALIYGKRSNFPDISLSKSHRFLPLQGKIKETVQEHLVDLVVYGRRANADRCEMFEEWVPQFQNRRYVLRDYDTQSNEDRSLNRCSVETKGFVPNSFKLGIPTPGTENDCTGASFLIEDYIPKVTGNIHIVEDVAEKSKSDARCTASSHTPFSSSMVQAAISEAMNSTQNDQCALIAATREGPSSQLTLNVGNKRKYRMDPPMDFSDIEEWNTEQYFK